MARASERQPPPRLVLRESAPAVDDILKRAHTALLKHPLAAQAAIATLIAEGREFAATPAGARWCARLARTDLVRRGQELWEGSGLGFFEDDPETALPSALLDSLLGTIATGDLMAVIRTLLDSLAEEIEGRAPTSHA